MPIFRGCSCGLGCARYTRAVGCSLGSSGGGVHGSEVLAARFNVFDHDAMRATCTAMGGVKGLMPVATRDYSGGWAAQALFRSPPVKHTLNLLALEVWEHALPGSVWWTDISHQYPPDFHSDCYARLFAEEHTAYAIQYYYPNKSSQCWCRSSSSWSAGLLCISQGLVWA